MKRLVALVVAIGLVVGAIAIRRAIDDDGDNGSGNPGTGQPRDTTAPATGRVICASDLGRVCDELGPNVEKQSPTETLARLGSGGALGADAWIVARPWAEIARGRGAPLGDMTTIASTPLAFYVTVANRDAVLGSCPNLDWKCLSGDSVKQAFDDPTKSISGLLTIVQQAATFNGSIDFGSNDFGRFERELAQLKRASKLPTVADVYVENGGLNFAAADLVTAVVAVGDAHASSAQYRGRTEAVAAAPPIAAEVVIVTVTGQKAPVKTDDIKSKFRSAGYDDKPPASAAKLPDADVIDALLKRWNEL